MERRRFLAWGLGTLAAGCAATPRAAPAPPRDGLDGLIPRWGWTVADVDAAQARPMGTIQRITVHHEGSPQPRTERSRTENAALLERIRRYHVFALGWADIGYHFAIDPAGRVWEARPLQWQGAHVRNRNEGNVGIVVLGNFEIQQPTEAQVERLAPLVASLRRRHDVQLDAVRTHRQWAPTICPGRHLQRRFDTMKAAGLFA
jgi:hypothetical protein